MARKPFSLALPTFKSTRAQKEEQPRPGAGGGLKLASRTTINALLIASLFYFISVIFLILVSYSNLPKAK